VFFLRRGRARGFRRGKSCISTEARRGVKPLFWEIKIRYITPAITLKRQSAFPRRYYAKSCESVHRKALVSATPYGGAGTQKISLGLDPTTSRGRRNFRRAKAALIRIVDSGRPRIDKDFYKGGLRFSRAAVGRQPPNSQRRAQAAAHHGQRQVVSGKKTKEWGTSLSGTSRLAQRKKPLDARGHSRFPRSNAGQASHMFLIRHAFCITTGGYPPQTPTFSNRC